mmetsp:Transcript_49992/g.92463  ORF Transcript_49992/g.92463 Transcript_49992/m.92463 type:complete len:315 (+) Transcript_49992:629-1573(+)
MLVPPQLTNLLPIASGSVYDHDGVVPRGGDELSVSFSDRNGPDPVAVIRQSVDAEARFDVPKFDSLVARGGNERRGSGVGHVYSSAAGRGRGRLSCCGGTPATRGALLRGEGRLGEGYEPNAGYRVVVAAEGSDAQVCVEVPKLDGKIRGRRRKVGARGSECDAMHRVGMALQCSHIFTGFMIPNLDRPVLTPTDRHRVYRMDRHASHHALMSLKRVRRRRARNHSPRAAPTPSSGTTAIPSSAGSVRVYLGVLRCGPLQLEDLALKAGDGRPLLFEDRDAPRRGSLVGRAGFGVGCGEGRSGDSEWVILVPFL